MPVGYKMILYICKENKGEQGQESNLNSCNLKHNCAICQRAAFTAMAPTSNDSISVSQW